MSAPQFEFQPFGSKLSWITGLVVAGNDDSGEVRAFGSGFLVGPGMAMTARHVVDDVFLHFTGKLPNQFKGEVPFGLQVGTADMTTGALVRWDVVGYHYSARIDITALVVEPRNTPPKLQVYPRLDVLPALVGEEISAYGYANTVWSADTRGAFKMSPEPRLATGVVREIHYQYRDLSSLPFPCVHTNARFDPGMSGGPVFNKEGQVFGIVCKNLPPSEPGDEHVSYIALIWPALGIRLGLSKPLIASSSIFIRDEAEAGRLQVQNLDFMSVRMDDLGDYLHFGNPSHSA